MLKESLGLENSKMWDYKNIQQSSGMETDHSEKMLPVNSGCWCIPAACQLPLSGVCEILPEVAFTLEN